MASSRAGSGHGKSASADRQPSGGRQSSVPSRGGGSRIAKPSDRLNPKTVDPVST